MPAPSAVSAPLTRREENRANTMQEIVDRGAAQVDESGADQLSLNAIAREMRVSGPALYRYVATRDELLTLIAVEGYVALSTALTEALAAAHRRRPAGRLLAVGTAYRRWALDHPHRYRLMFADPRGTGGDPHARAGIRAAAEPAMSVLMAALGGADPGQPGPLRVDPDEAGPAGSALRAWIRLHGVVSLELSGALDSMGLDGASLVRTELEGS